MLFCTLAGCASILVYGDEPGSVTIISYWRSGAGEVVRVVKPEQIAKCEALFPGYRSTTSSEVAGGWVTKYEFFFNFQDVSLRVFSDGENWSNGSGDFPVQGNIDEVVLQARSR